MNMDGGNREMQVIIIILGGGGGGIVLLLVIALVLAALVGSGALAGLIAALTMFLIWLAAIVVGGALLAGVIWFLTRGYRARKNEAAEYEAMQRQIAYDRRQDERRIERQQQRAIEQATAMMPIAAVIGEAIRQGNSTPTADDIAEALLRQRQPAYAPPVWR